MEVPYPEEPKIEIFKIFRPGLKFSSENEPSIENEISSEPHSKGPNCGEFSRSRLKFSSENEVFKRE